MSQTSADDRTPTGQDPQLGRPFQIVALVSAGTIVVAQLGILLSAGAATSADPGLFFALWAICVLFTVIAALRDMFRPGRAVPWLMLGAVLLAVMVASGSSQGAGGIRVPLFYEVGTNVEGSSFAYSPLLQTFRSLPYTLFVTLGDLGFWGVAIAWVMTLIKWRRKPKPRESGPARPAGRSGGPVG